MSTCGLFKRQAVKIDHDMITILLNQLSFYILSQEFGRGGLLLNLILVYLWVVYNKSKKKENHIK